MRTALLLIVVAAACGGGSRKAPAQPPADEQIEGEIIRPDEREGGPNVRASQDVSTTTAPSTTPASFNGTPLPADTPQPAAKGCDAQPFLTEGKDKLAQNMPAQALAAFERAIVCVHDPISEELAVTAACKAKLYSRAKAHLVRVPEASRAKLAELCSPPSE